MKKKSRLQRTTVKPCLIQHRSSTCHPKKHHKLRKIIIKSLKGNKKKRVIKTLTNLICFSNSSTESKSNINSSRWCHHIILTSKHSSITAWCSSINNLQLMSMQDPNHLRLIRSKRKEFRKMNSNSSSSRSSKAFLLWIMALKEGIHLATNIIKVIIVQAIIKLLNSKSLLKSVILVSSYRESVAT